jgi:hypothetical protein
MESVFIYLSTLFFLFGAFIVRWSSGFGNLLIRFFLILMAIYGIVLSLVRLGFMLPPPMRML